MCQTSLQVFRGVKYRNLEIFLKEKQTLLKWGDSQASLAKEIYNGSPAASKGKEENLGFPPLEGIGVQQGPDRPNVNNQ